MELDEKFFEEPKNNKGNYGIEEFAAQSGEKILWHGKPNGKAFIIDRTFKMAPVALLWLIFDGTFIAIMASGMAGYMDWWFYLVIAGFFALHLTPVWIWLGNIISAFRKRKNTEYAFTERRIILKGGFFPNFKSIYYNDITSVDLKIGLIERTFNVGDIVLKNASGASYIIDDIENPYFILERLQKITLDIKSDMQYPNDLRPPENHGYNTKYRP